MKIKEIDKVLSEIDRLKDAAIDVKTRINSDPHYREYGIYGTKESGNLKREYLSLKYKLNKLILNRI
jgi:hypothetical protein